MVSSLTASSVVVSVTFLEEALGKDVAWNVLEGFDSETIALEDVVANVFDTFNWFLCFRNVSMINLIAFSFSFLFLNFGRFLFVFRPVLVLKLSLKNFKRSDFTLGEVLLSSKLFLRWEL